MAVGWFINGGVFPVTVDGGGATCKCETSSPLLMADGFRASFVQILGHGSFWFTVATGEV